jgi:hypothetical protein
MSLPADFAPALIFDASGRVRESYRTMEASGILQRLPSATMDYSRLHIHHWDRAASRSTLEQPAARAEVLSAAADVINATGPGEQWLVVHAKDRQSSASSIVQDLADLIDNPSRLSFLHWGNHHGTNAYRHIDKVLVLGLWTLPSPAYSALHVAAGGEMSLATDKATVAAIRAGEHQHNLLQAICRASVRNVAKGACGDCEVWLVGKLGKDPSADLGPSGLLHDTFPGAMVTSWNASGRSLRGSPLRVAQAIETAFREPGVRQVSKAAVRASVGMRTGEGLAKVLRGDAFRRWAGDRGVKVTVRSFELRQA